MQQVYKIIVIVEWTKIEIKFGSKSWGFNWCLSWIRLQLDCNRTAGVKYSVFTTIATGGDKDNTQLLLRPSYVLKVLHIDQSGLPYCSLWSSFLAQPVKIWSNRMTEDTKHHYEMLFQSAIKSTKLLRYLHTCQTVFWPLLHWSHTLSHTIVKSAFPL